MKKITLFVVIAAAIIFYIYHLNTQYSEVKQNMLYAEFDKRKERQKRLVNVEQKYKARIDYYFGEKEKVNTDEAIMEFQKVDSLALKSRIIEALALYKLEDPKTRDFLLQIVGGEDEFMAAIVIKNLSISNENQVFQVLKNIMLSGKSFDNQTYTNMVIALAKKAPDEEKELYINKLKSMLDSLSSASQRNVLRALLVLTNGSQEIIDLINKRLERLNDLSFEMFAMTDLSKYDSAWIDKKRDKFINHKSAHIRSMFVQNLKYYCPKDLWEIMQKFVEDPNKDVRENIFRELTSFGKRSLPFLEKNKEKLKLDKNRVKSMLRKLEKGVYDKKNYCPDL